MDKKLIKDIEEWVDTVAELKVFLNTLYYNKDIAVILGRPIISFLITGTDFLRVNLEALASKWATHVR